MTDTAREAAFERVRYHLETLKAYPDDTNIYPWLTTGPITLGDLRLLLSGGDGGRHLAKDALPRGETHPCVDEAPVPLNTPLAVELPFYLDRRHYAAAGDAVVKLGLPCHHDKIIDTVWGALREEGRQTALTDPRQPSEAAHKRCPYCDHRVAWGELAGFLADAEPPVTADEGWGPIDARPCDDCGAPVLHMHEPNCPAISPAPPTGEGGGL